MGGDPVDDERCQCGCDVYNLTAVSWGFRVEAVSADRVAVGYDRFLRRRLR